MVAMNKFVSVYEGRGREYESRASSLFIAHIVLMTGILLISVLFVLEGRYTRLITGGVLFLSYVFSLSLGYRGFFDASAYILSFVGFIFMALMALSNDLTHPYALHMTALYLVAPTLMTAVITRGVKSIYILAFATVAVIVYVFVTQVIPMNRNQGIGHLVLQYLGFVIILLGFIAHFVMRKHRTADHLLEDADAAVGLAARRSHSMEQLLSEVTESFQITKELSTEIQLIDDQIQSANRNLEQIQGDLQDFLNRHNSSSENVDAISTQILNLNEAIYSQSSAQEQTAAATNEMVASINNVADIVARKSDSAVELKKTTERGGEQLEDTVMRIQDISRNIDDIQQMVGLINDIASQTNLLSMNAAIEAAHAGDSGRGFSVVAEEIRKLAESSSENAGKINNVLKNIVQSIDDGQASGNQSKEAFQRVINEVNETANALSEISNSTHELNAGSKEILSAVDSLNVLSKQVRQGSDSINESQEHLHTFLETTSKGIHSMVDDVRNIAEGNAKLEAAISHITAIVTGLNDINEKIHAANRSESE